MTLQVLLSVEGYDVCIFLLFLILMFRLSLSDGMVDGPVQTGPTDMVDGHRAYRLGVLFLSWT